MSMPPGPELPELSAAELPRLAPRAVDSHKGDFGRALLVGGARGMAGAIGLAGMAALRSGAGLVRLAVAQECLDTVAAYEPSYMTAPLPSDGEGRLVPAALPQLREWAQTATCVGLGPGLSRSDGVTELVLALYEQLACPLVIDADALFALAANPDRLSSHAGPRILTPHPGEFQRLAGSAERLPRPQQELRAIELAGRHQLVLVLKGSRTLITDGTRHARNATGNPGMASGGSGDVLTGILTALVCQGLEPWDAARLAAYVHGLSGDLAAAELGQVGMIARDLIDYLPAAFRHLECH